MSNSWEKTIEMELKTLKDAWNKVIDAQNKRISELEEFQTLEVWSARLTDIETVIGLNYKGNIKLITPLTKQIAELRNLIQGNAITDLNHYELLSAKLKRGGLK